jgi:hypothetical protein
MSIDWLRFYQLYDKKAELLLWIPSRPLWYLGTDSFIWDMATVAGFIHEGLKFKIVAGNGIGRYYDKKIFFSLNNGYNLYRFSDYTSILQHITAELEKQGNAVFPKAAETVYWENKAYMHQQFEIANVHEPPTRIIHSINEVLTAKLNYPFLIKEEHSCASEGLHKIADYAALVDVVCSERFVRNNKQFIVQELINMRKDLRVILVKGEIVLHYWRINHAKEWLPTSTTYGSSVDFGSFPERWRAHIVRTFKSLNLVTGAFDITWQNDDLNTEPIYLEVSPFYQPNPIMDVKDKAYAFYKKHFQLFNSWDTKYVDIVFTIKHKQVQAYLSQSL